MRTVTKIFNVYKYHELSDEAKETAKQWCLEDETRTPLFKDMLEEDLSNMFPNSYLKVQFSLSYCQGDGVNINGGLNVKDFLTVVTNKAYNESDDIGKFVGCLTPEEISIIEKAMYRLNSYDVTLPFNSRYSYCIADRISFADEWIDELFEDEEGVQSSDEIVAIRKLNKYICEMFTALAHTYEKQGYEYFYEISDEAMEEECETNDWEFTEAGNFYNGAL